MQVPELKPVLASLLLSTVFMNPVAAADFNDDFTQDTDSIFAIEADPYNEMAYAQVDGTQLPYNDQPRKDYLVTLSGRIGTLIAPSWVLTSSHVIGWDQQKYPENISFNFPGRNGTEYRGQRVFRHPYKDLALVLLQTPIAQGREPVLMMMDVLRKGHGQINIKKVARGEPVADILAESGGQQNMISGDEADGSFAGGSPWVVESSLVGDVLIGVADGSGHAPQVAYARKWMQQIVEANTPDETLYWAGFAQALPDHINSQPMEVLPEPEVIPEAKPSLIILP